MMKSRVLRCLVCNQTPDESNNDTYVDIFTSSNGTVLSSRLERILDARIESSNCHAKVLCQRCHNQVVEIEGYYQIIEEFRRLYHQTVSFHKQEESRPEALDSLIDTGFLELEKLLGIDHNDPSVQALLKAESSHRSENDKDPFNSKIQNTSWKDSHKITNSFCDINIQEKSEIGEIKQDGNTKNKGRKICNRSRLSRQISSTQKQTNSNSKHNEYSVNIITDECRTRGNGTVDHEKDSVLFPEQSILNEKTGDVSESMEINTQQSNGQPGFEEKINDLDSKTHSISASVSKGLLKPETVSIQPCDQSNYPKEGAVVPLENNINENKKDPPNRENNALLDKELADADMSSLATDNLATRTSARKRKLQDDAPAKETMKLRRRLPRQASQQVSKATETEHSIEKPLCIKVPESKSPPKELPTFHDEEKKDSENLPLDDKSEITADKQPLSTSNSYTCSTCQSGFKTRHDFYRHIRTCGKTSQVLSKPTSANGAQSNNKQKIDSCKSSETTELQIVQEKEPLSPSEKEKHQPDLEKENIDKTLGDTKKEELGLDIPCADLEIKTEDLCDKTNSSSIHIPQTKEAPEIKEGLSVEGNDKNLKPEQSNEIKDENAEIKNEDSENKEEIKKDAIGSGQVSSVSKEDNDTKEPLEKVDGICLTTSQTMDPPTTSLQTSDSATSILSTIEPRQQGSEQVTLGQEIPTITVNTPNDSQNKPSFVAQPAIGENTLKPSKKTSQKRDKSPAEGGKAKGKTKKKYTKKKKANATVDATNFDGFYGNHDMSMPNMFHSQQNRYPLMHNLNQNGPPLHMQGTPLRHMNPNQQPYPSQQGDFGQSPLGNQGPNTPNMFVQRGTHPPPYGQKVGPGPPHIGVNPGMRSPQGSLGSPGMLSPHSQPYQDQNNQQWQSMYREGYNIQNQGYVQQIGAQPEQHQIQMQQSSSQSDLQTQQNMHLQAKQQPHLNRIEQNMPSQGTNPLMHIQNTQHQMQGSGMNVQMQQYQDGQGNIQQTMHHQPVSQQFSSYPQQQMLGQQRQAQLQSPPPFHMGSNQMQMSMQGQPGQPGQMNTKLHNQMTSPPPQTQNVLNQGQMKNPGIQNVSGPIQQSCIKLDQITPMDTMDGDKDQKGQLMQNQSIENSNPLQHPNQPNYQHHVQQTETNQGNPPNLQNQFQMNGPNQINRTHCANLQQQSNQNQLKTSQEHQQMQHQHQQQHQQQQQQQQHHKINLQHNLSKEQINSQRFMKQGISSPEKNSLKQQQMDASQMNKGMKHNQNICEISSLKTSPKSLGQNMPITSLGHIHQTNTPHSQSQNGPKYPFVNTSYGAAVGSNLSRSPQGGGTNIYMDHNAGFPGSSPQSVYSQNACGPQTQSNRQKSNNDSRVATPCLQGIHPQGQNMQGNKAIGIGMHGQVPNFPPRPTPSQPMSQASHMNINTSLNNLSHSGPNMPPHQLMMHSNLQQQQPQQQHLQQQQQHMPQHQSQQPLAHHPHHNLNNLSQNNTMNNPNLSSTSSHDPSIPLQQAGFQTNTSNLATPGKVPLVQQGGPFPGPLQGAPGSAGTSHQMAVGVGSGGGGGGNSEFKAPPAEGGFSCASALVNLAKTHADPKPFRCMQCDSSFFSADMLMEHTRVHVEDTSNAGSLSGGETNHDDLDRMSSNATPASSSKDMSPEPAPSPQPKKQRKNREPKSWRCTKCNISCSSAEEWAEHRRSHLGEKAYHCPTCGTAFAAKWYLTRHQRTHSGEKPHKCDVCGKAFGRPDHLRKHMTIHASKPSPNQSESPNTST